jgi:hypothetical protein
MAAAVMAIAAGMAAVRTVVVLVRAEMGVALAVAAALLVAVDSVRQD